MPFVTEETLQRLLISGARMSNMCFNLRQRKAGEPLTDRDIIAMECECREWNSALRSLSVEQEDRRKARRKEATFRLPFPKSVNSHWKTRIFWPKRWYPVLKSLIAKYGRPRADVYVSKEGKDYRDGVRKALPRGLRPVRDRLDVTLRLCRGDRRSYDIQNYQKGLLDSLTAVSVWADDSQIDRLEIIRGPVSDSGGHVDVTIRVIQNPQTELFDEQEGLPW